MLVGRGNDQFTTKLRSAQASDGFSVVNATRRLIISNLECAHCRRCRRRCCYGCVQLWRNWIRDSLLLSQHNSQSTSHYESTNVYFSFIFVFQFALNSFFLLFSLLFAIPCILLFLTRVQHVRTNIFIACRTWFMVSGKHLSPEHKRSNDTQHNAKGRNGIRVAHALVQERERRRQVLRHCNKQHSKCATVSLPVWQWQTEWCCGLASAINIDMEHIRLINTISFPITLIMKRFKWWTGMVHVRREKYGKCAKWRKCQPRETPTRKKENSPKKSQWWMRRFSNSGLFRRLYLTTSVLTAFDGLFNTRSRLEVLLLLLPPPLRPFDRVPLVVLPPPTELFVIRATDELLFWFWWWWTMPLLPVTAFEWIEPSECKLLWWTCCCCCCCCDW